MAAPTHGLVDGHFWIHNEGNKDGELKFKVQKLLDNGADLTYVGEDKWTALHYATKYKAGHEVVELLLRKGASSTIHHCTEKYLTTPLQMCMLYQAGHQIVRLLLEHGANVHAVDNTHKTALHLACEKKAGWEVVKLLLGKGADVHAVNDDKETALHYACGNQAGPEVVGLLLGKGADVHAVNQHNSWTPLHCAAKSHSAPDVVAMLLEHGANVHAEDKDKRTALHLAASFQASPEVVGLLLDKGADVSSKAADAEPYYGRTSLHFACEKQASAELVELLLKQDINVNCLDRFKKTPLMHAVSCKAGPRVVDLLLQSGAKKRIHDKDRFQSCALQLAKDDHAEPEVLGLLLLAGACHAKILGNEQVAEALAAVYDPVFMRATANFIDRIDLYNPKLLTAYVEALSSAPDDDEKACPNKIARLAEARALREHKSSFDAACNSLKAAIDARLQVALESAIVGAEKALVGLMKSPLFAEELRRLLDEEAKPLLDLVIYENARAPLDAAIAARDQAMLEAAVAGAEAAALEEPMKSSPSAEEFRCLINKGIADLFATILKDAHASLDAAMKKHEAAVEQHEAAKAAMPPGMNDPPARQNPFLSSPSTAELSPLLERVGAYIESNDSKVLRLTEAKAIQTLACAIGARDQNELEKAIRAAEAVSTGGQQGTEPLKLFVDTAKPLLDLVTLQNEQRDRPDELRIYMVPRAVIVAMLASPDTPRLRVFQDLRRCNELKAIYVTPQQVLSGALITQHKLLAISYPWQGFGDPDSTDDRLKTVVALLEERPDIEYVWWDFMCVPQTTNIPDRVTGEVEHRYPTTYKKNEFDKRYFKAMINEGGVNLIYLGAHVLSIANALYIQRFWTQFEYYLGTRTVTGNKFGSTRKRLTVRCIQSLEGTNEEQSVALLAKWLKKSTEEAKETLAKKDVTVTNKSDKVNLLGKLAKLEADYDALFMALPEEVRGRLLAEQAKEEEGAVEVDTVDSLRKELADANDELAAAHDTIKALKKELADANGKSVKRNSKKVHP